MTITWGLKWMFSCSIYFTNKSNNASVKKLADQTETSIIRRRCDLLSFENFLIKVFTGGKRTSRVYCSRDGLKVQKDSQRQLSTSHSTAFEEFLNASLEMSQLKILCSWTWHGIRKKIGLIQTKKILKSGG